MSSEVESSATSIAGWKQVFACDVRSLAILRIALGVLILIDLAMRATALQAMYTDAGFYSIADRTAHVAEMSDTDFPFSWSIHALNGSLTWQVALFVLAAIAATMMIIGWKTRIACVVGWILLVSMQMRNPLILHSGDVLFRMAMFWCMFLPLGAVWSLDRKLVIKRGGSAPPIHNPVVSGATCGLILTLFSLYFFAGIAKLNPVWYSGEAMDYVLKLDIYATAFGKSLLAYPLLLKWITWATLWAEIVLPIMLLVPWKNRLWRYVSMAVFVSLHLAIAACMVIGLFSWVAIAIWMALLPSSFWERIGSKTSQVIEPVAFDRDRKLTTRLANVICLILAGYFFAWNLATIEHPAFRSMMPQEARVVGKWLNLRQSFRMFDVPPKHSCWFVYEARLKNGTEIDFFRNARVDHSRPESVRETIPTHHWRRLHRNLARPEFKAFRKSVSEYLIRRWNESHDEESQIEVARTTAYLEEITPWQESRGTVTQVWHLHGEEIAQQDLFDDLLKKMKDKGIILP